MRLRCVVIGMVAWACLAALARTESLVLDYSFQRPMISTVKSGDTTYDRVTMTGAPNCGSAGQPALPAMGCQILLPFGAEVSRIRVLTDEEVPLGSGYLIEPVGRPIALSEEPDVNASREPAPAIYGSEQPFPGTSFETLGTFSFRGYQILVLKLQPVQYVPKSGALSYHARLTVVVETVAAGRFSSLYRGLAGDEAAVRARVDNPAVANSYPASGPRDGRSYGMLILTPTWLQAAFQPLKEYHDAHGLPTEIHTTTDVGSTNPEAVRNYIRDRYLNDGIEYVLIGGDSEAIPARGMYVLSFVGGPVSYDTPADMYFGCLDGTWNHDGDSYWGEPTDGEGGGDVDMMAEVYVGRAATDTEAEVARFIDKTLWYLDGYHTQPANALMVGEYLGWYGGPLWGGDYMDELIDGSSAHGYTTVGIPSDDYQVEILYDRDWPGNAWPAAELTTRINGGLHLINHLGHGNVNYAMKLYDSDIVNSLTNDDLCFVYSQTCLAGHFDSYDCWAEMMNVKTDQGSFALIMNAREGWGVTEGTDGASQRFQREFWDAVFGEGLPEIGRANQDSKEDNLYRINDECMRWCAYELNVFGDPSVGIRGTCVLAGTITLDLPKYACESTAHILVNDCGLNTDDNVAESVVVAIDSSSETGVEHVTLTETTPASAKFAGSIPLHTSNDAGVLWVTEGDTVTVTYIDEDDGYGGSGIVVTCNAVVDCTPPEISNVHAQIIDERNATILFDTDEPARGTIHLGLSCESLTQTVAGSDYSTTPSLHLSGLDDDTTYFYAVEAEDEAGNITIDDNDGNCFTFVTARIPNYFTELFASGQNDLDNMSLIFIPDGSVDFYAACAEEITELPTDPAGGTPLTSDWADDDYASVTLDGGATVSLYGTNYSTFCVGTNGYVTFGSGDTSGNETLNRQFDRPRISALFDDLDLSAGGTLSWKDCGDWVAVTFENVPERDTSNSNTFQIEMFANGTITISFLSIAATDGLTGLSEGQGTPPYFSETNLSALGTCGPRPPRVRNLVTSTAVDVGLTMTLPAFDEGLPDPPGALTYVVTSLPDHGQLTDPLVGLIETIPYTLAGGGDQLAYQPDPGYWGDDPFHFEANDGGTPPEGGDSVNSVVSLTVGGPDWDPVAHEMTWATPISTPGAITLSASDPNDDPLTYIIESLPALGMLSDPAAGLIEVVPYTLVGGGNVVHYQPPFGQNLVTSFDFSVRDATMGSNVATVTVLVGGTDVIYGFYLSSNPGWTITPGSQWAFGDPTGHGGTYYGHPDPDTGVTGANVYGVNLNGDYSTTPGGPYYLTVGPLDFTGIEDVTLKFHRWLNTDMGSYARATVEVSSDGMNWTTLWQSPSNSAVTDDAWSQQVFDLSAFADNQAAVYICWGYQIFTSAYPYSGWNLDDVELWGLDVEPDQGDLDGDSDVDSDDFNIFAGCLNGPGMPYAPECGNADLVGDGDVDLADFVQFQQAMTDGVP